MEIGKLSISNNELLRSTAFICCCTYVAMRMR